ncbi:unnamed protein product [Chironomus riparius]|uniref:Elongation of very long chain fatty acids protein n=1 Tax=Chironomus riparius TaxID=315576 RepID=A0A9N9WZW1_9DIPT|nr:unnamed protein product [Chironomus riparius]
MMWNINSKIDTLIQSYHEIFYTNADPRIRDKFLMGNPALITTIYIVYIFFIKVVLKKFMKNRPPFRLKIFENFLVFLLFGSSLYFFIISSNVWFFHYNWKCEAIDRSKSSLAMWAVNNSYLYLLSKFFYIFESVVLSLRKNHSYLETYLLIHHFFYPIGIWSTINYFPGGHALFLGFVNSFAHTVMFGYHLIANNFCMKLKLYRFKGAVNGLMLIIQLILFFPHTIQLFFKNDCNFPIEYPILVFVVIFTALPFIIIFVIPRAFKYHKSKLITRQNLQIQKTNLTLSYDLEKIEQT